jgi:hypothetical protein
MKFTAVALLILWSFHGYAPNLSAPNSDDERATVNAQQAGDADALADRKAAVAIVLQIQRADYEGDRAALNKLYDDLVPYVDNFEFASRIRYWRGFAKWRRAINGFNETPTPKDLAKDLTEGEAEFDAAFQRDPAFFDAKIGAASCMLFRAYQSGKFANVKDIEIIRKALAPASQLLKEAQAVAPDNPRLLWVMGPNQWNVPPASVGQAKAMEMYQLGLKTIRSQKIDSSDPLQPTWGEPELLMNVAWSNLHKTEPDLAAAEQSAQAALQLVPYWHYVRDILLQQIHDAQKKAH